MKPYRIPVVCWIATITGLSLALVTEGFGDGIALALLCLPLIVIARAWSRPLPSRSRNASSL